MFAFGTIFKNSSNDSLIIININLSIRDKVMHLKLCSHNIVYILSMIHILLINSIY